MIYIYKKIENESIYTYYAFLNNLIDEKRFREV